MGISKYEILPRIKRRVKAIATCVDIAVVKDADRTIYYNVLEVCVSSVRSIGEALSSDVMKDRT